MIGACLTLSLLALAPATTDATPATAPAPVDPELWSMMSAIDAKVAQITDLRATFTQEKHTPLLKKPLTSTGEVRVKGTRTLWRTDAPERSVMLVDGSEIRLYYPDQRMMEIYPVHGRLGALAASPLPRLDVLREFFTFEQIDASDDKPNILDVRLTPTDESLREHVDEVRVRLNRDTGLIEQVETIDPDGDRTVIRFTDTRINAGLSDDDLRLDVPEGTTVSRPLEGLDSEGASP
jgi:outer membrane lipoprotein-sorting protein